MRELEKIKKERVEDERKKQEHQEQEEEEEKDNAIKFGNPLLEMGQQSSFNMKKRWYDDVVFKNQARDEPQKKKRFINDTIRSDFHRKFLSKYIQ